MTQKIWQNELASARVAEGVNRHEAEQRAEELKRREAFISRINRLDFRVTASGDETGLVFQIAVSKKDAEEITRYAAKHLDFKIEAAHNLENRNARFMAIRGTGNITKAVQKGITFPDSDIFKAAADRLYPAEETATGHGGR